MRIIMHEKAAVVSTSLFTMLAKTREKEVTFYEPHLLKYQLQTGGLKIH